MIESARKNTASGLLFSGGLDSAILASVNSKVKAITVSLKSYGEDRRYANSAAKFLKIEHYQRSVDIDEAIDAVPEVIKILKTFDPAILNDLVVYFGLKKAKELGINEVMTGDGSDELFAGYSFMQKADDLKGYIERMSRKMKFSSNRIGEFFKIKIIQPFLDKEFIDFSLGIKPELKIKKQEGRVWGKWILRKSFEDSLPKDIVWQSKRPLEYGSGMKNLCDIISIEISDGEFKKDPYPVKFINKEHLYYYKIYRRIIGAIPKAKKGQRKCPVCSTGIAKGALHCYLCGWAKPIK